ncbi:HNH endonuclease [Salinibacterium sp. TMP30]|uniref:HNH endonuclease signature motif containing protein n=1 Tax=Salinibacterium sp. TMP30 TaxID=3138237 RepID=UPI003138DF3F
MLELKDYIGLTEADARSQWLSILQRVDPGGRRQVDFVPLETLLCFGLGLIAEPSSSGTINIRESSREAQRLAALFKRPTKSLAAKLANLDGRRPNGAKHERQLWAMLSNDLVLFEHLYELAFTAGRSVGLDNARLPDFLGIETSTLRAFIEADQITNDALRESVESDLRDWVDGNPSGDATETEKVLLGTARVGQQQFARSVLNNCGFACVFCGMSFRANGLPSSRMLVASHIKSWKASTNKERLSVGNGVAACPTHDAAFDGFLLTFSPDLRVIRSPLLESAIAHDDAVARQFGSNILNSTVVAGRFRKSPSHEFIAWHNHRFSLLVQEKISLV